MKKLLAVTACIAMLGALAFASSGSMTGYIVSEKCGAKDAHDGSEACVKKCAEAGSPLAFVSDKDQSVLKLDNPDAVKGHEGHHVSVKGSVKDGTLHIDELAMAAEQPASGGEHQH